MAFVMIVDDNQAQCRLMSKLMDLLILGYMMPGMDGLESLQALRGGNRANDIPVALFTADDDPQLSDRAYSAGAGHHSLFRVGDHE